ncbi:MAG: hypothetical protein M0C28_30535 [Candidatus Moduliflexus flocculans]|nr:hypothetical protein [Candidatus Moduliflexus flocculans]
MRPTAPVGWAGLLPGPGRPDPTWYPGPGGGLRPRRQPARGHVREVHPQVLPVSPKDPGALLRRPSPRESSPSRRTPGSAAVRGVRDGLPDLDRTTCPEEPRPARRGPPP